ncbi:MAG: DNA polymerase-3 subunit alpha (Gram-positive type) [Bacteriovoracaceae bacterium]|jgi:DNA polymerase-3 subunit alpha (Gram-positive type)
MTNKEPVSVSDEIQKMSFCVFDLETTGGNHKNDKIIEIGMVRIENLKVVKEASYLIQPEIHIPEFIQKLTSITPDDVSDSPKIEEVVDEILAFMGDSILVAHNTSFDVPFFNSVLRRLGKPELSNRSLCTNLMTKYLIPNLMNSNLNYMSKIFDIQHRKAHRALDDASATAELLLNYLKIFIDKNIQKVNHLYYPRNRYELDRIHFKNDESKEVIKKKLSSMRTPGLITFKGENGVILFALPLRNSTKEKEFIAEQIDKIDWEMITIRVYGPFLESLVHFSNLFSKLDTNVRMDVLRFLWEEHLPSLKMPAKMTDEDATSVGPILERGFGDFVITNHLVPEQMIIFPISALHQKSCLIFRYPSHRKKLIQYINSKSSRMTNNKLKKIHIHPTLKIFIDTYLKNSKENKSDLFIFNKNIPQKNPDQFVSELEEFLTNNPNTYNYPKEYI